uniref:F-box domain-containing protein n=1 Tax=Setaria italica TaxID=4555 RepID=K4A342_SETIT
MAPLPHRPRKKRRIPDATAPAVASDALLSLPPEVLDEILSRLDLRDAVRTSALCRAWRRRWESLPSLDINIPYDQQALWTVDCVLPRCSGRVRRFHTFLDELSARRLDDWLLVFSRRGGVEDLNIHRNDNKFFPLHSSVFSWRRLRLPRPLHLLILSEVFIGGDCFIEWEIRAPNLWHLTICSPYDCGWNLVDLPCLHSAVIELWEYGDRDFAKFLSGLVHVRKLMLSTFYAPVNGVSILETLPCTFGNLEILKLLMHFSELPPILFMFCLLRNTPNLEKLKILICWGEEQKIEANEEFLNAQWTDRMCAKLQVVQLTVSHKDPLNELLKCRRALAQAQVLFQGKET